jgi:thiol:disulfide interchange protein DsbD
VPVGGTLLFTYALGMGVLFWVLAAFAVALPKSGRWMEWVKSVGGIALLAAAIYILRPVVPALEDLSSAQLWFLAVGVALVLAGVALGAVHLSFHDGAMVKLRKGVAVALAVVGLSAVIGWMLTPDRHLPWVYRDATQVAAMTQAQDLHPAPKHPLGGEWLDGAEAAAFAQAAAQGKGVMLDFSANWCVPCKKLELEFAKGDVYDQITANFVPLKIDVTDGTDEDDAFQDRYGARTLPSVVFVDARGAVLGRYTSEGDPSALHGVLSPAIAQLHGAAGATPCVAAR